MTYLQKFRSSGSTIHQIHINLFIFDADSFTSQIDKSARSWQIHTMNFYRTHFDKSFKDFLKIFKAQVDHWVVGKKVRKIMPVFRWQHLFEDGRGFKVRLSVNYGQNCRILSKYTMPHSVPEWIWIKGSYLSQWLPQGERGPPKESKSRWIEILNGGSQFTLWFLKIKIFQNFSDFSEIFFLLYNT